jgi:hypothetical protein
MQSFVPIPPEIIAMKLGRALELYTFLVRHQTSADGAVHYGQPIGYAWIRARWPGNPEERPSIDALQKQLKKLKRRRLVETRREWRGGIRVRVLWSVKLGTSASQPVQLALFGRGVVAMPKISVEKLSKTSASPDFNTAKSGANVPPNWRNKEVRGKS